MAGEIQGEILQLLVCSGDRRESGGLVDSIRISGTFRLMFSLDVGLLASSFRFRCLLLDYLLSPAGVQA